MGGRRGGARAGRRSQRSRATVPVPLRPQVARVKAGDVRRSGSGRIKSSSSPGASS